MLLIGYFLFTWDANDDPANGGQKTYVFDDNKTAALLGGLADTHAVKIAADENYVATALNSWIVKSEANSINVENPRKGYGYGCNKPGFYDSSSTGNLLFAESVFPKRVFSAYGADLADLLTSDSRTDVETEIATAVTAMSTKANARFTDASGSVDTSSTGTDDGTDTALAVLNYMVKLLLLLLLKMLVVDPHH